jgi:hypothetical protein
VESCKHANESLDSIKVWISLDLLSHCKHPQLLQHTETVKLTYILDVFATSYFWVEVMQKYREDHLLFVRQRAAMHVASTALPAVATLQWE